MKTALVIEDSPQGLKVKLAYQPSGCTDHLADSLAMNLMGTLIEHIRHSQNLGLLKLVSEEVSRS